MKEEKIIIEKIESAHQHLSPEDRASLWRAIAPTLPKTHLIVSPYLYLFNSLTKNSMIPLALILAVILGGGGTALASDASRPGDLLFPLDRTLEEIHMKLTRSEEGRALLVQNLSHERLSELRQIIDESILLAPSDDSISNEDVSNIGTSTPLEIEADIFTDITVVKTEINDRKSYFETSADSRNEVIDDIQKRYPSLTTAQIDSVLNLEIEDRASRPKDKGSFSVVPQGEERIGLAVGEILNFIEKSELDNERRNYFLTSLFSEVDDVSRRQNKNGNVRLGDEDKRIEIRTDDDGDGRIEFRNGNERIRIEEKDGEVRIKTHSSDDDDDSARSSNRSDLGIENTFSSTPLEIEADIFTDITVVKIEINDRKSYFETSADSRNEVIDDIQKRYPSLTTAQIDSVLNLEIEDRASRPKDVGDDSNDDSHEDDNSDNSRDDAKSDDSSGGHSGRDDSDPDDDEESSDDSDDDNSGKGSDND